MALDYKRFPADILAEADEKLADDTSINEFEGLDLRQASCFGYECPKAN